MVFGIDDSVIVGFVVVALIGLILLRVAGSGHRKHRLVGLLLNRDGSGILKYVHSDKWGIIRHDGGAYPIRPEHPIPLKGGLVTGRLVVIRKDVPAPLLLTPPEDGAKPILSVKGVFGLESPGYEVYHNPAFAPDGEPVPLDDRGLPHVEAGAFLEPDWKSAYELEELISERKLAEYHSSGEEPSTSYYWWITWALLIAILGAVGYSTFG